MNNFLQDKLLTILQAHTYCSIDLLSENLHGVFSRVKIKEELISLLKEKKVRNLGNRWYITKEPANVNTDDRPIKLYATCPNCSTFYSILPELVNNEVECQKCKAYFLIHNEMISENEHKTILLGD